MEEKCMSLYELLSYEMTKNEITTKSLKVLNTLNPDFNVDCKAYGIDNISEIVIKQKKSIIEISFPSYNNVLKKIDNNMQTIYKKFIEDNRGLLSTAYLHLLNENLLENKVYEIISTNNDFLVKIINSNILIYYIGNGNEELLQPKIEKNKDGKIIDVKMYTSSSLLGLTKEYMYDLNEIYFNFEDKNISKLERKI